ncbi:MAG: hypothetical protein IBX43_05210 [Campylobacterales bacterium]|nr:hypothetical protein [Campylobacterales bacterium]
MHFIALFLVSVLAFSAEFPKTFSSAGDRVYESMHRYMKIRHLQIYQEKPEFLEAFCQDANKTMRRGFALDAIQADPEAKVDKNMIKSYAKELRSLSQKDEHISKQIKKDMLWLYQQKKFESLEVMGKAGFVLSEKMQQSIDENKKNKGVKTEKSSSERHIAPSLPLVSAASMEKSAEEKPSIAAPQRELSELEYYQQSLANLKEELCVLRESEEQTQTACLNDITAINYWMIKILENERDACALSDAIKQMKSYDKKSAKTCGRNSMRYIEWHGRIKPYAGKRLFQAEAACHR